MTTITDEWRAVLLCHALGQLSAQTEVLFETRLIESVRYARMPRQPCKDCAAGPPEIVRELPPGYDSGLLIEHSATCPAMRAALRRKGGQQ